ncbi:hypothetical protein DU508_15575 [Pedobacter chinensis]|uniref:Uncharacterized protein n=1 Tax=Pedobacter chinensis TaxID=2282421 RepID=A0A369Q034_9SPHI|nr:hypothetical protein [Pedobacter chinensis]RDC55688.1 hypothetical protein DU508_15575 [Pedobacter chinensis]
MNKHSIFYQTQNTIKIFNSFEEAKKDEIDNIIDFMTKINLDKANKRKIIAEVDDLKIPFLYLDDLALSKFNIGRIIKCKVDIESFSKFKKIENLKVSIV